MRLQGSAAPGTMLTPMMPLRPVDLPTSGFTAIIPFGVGAKLAFDPNILFGIELTGRYAFSDYLDGYTSQWSERNDVYHTFSVTFNYRIKTARNGLAVIQMMYQMTRGMRKDSNTDNFSCTGPTGSGTETCRLRLLPRVPPITLASINPSNVYQRPGPAAQFFYRYNFNPRQAVRANLTRRLTPFQQLQ